MFVLDSNVLVYAANLRASEHEICRSLLESLSRSRAPWFLSWPILFEFLRVVTHRRVLERPRPLPEAWAFVEALLASPSLRLLLPSTRHAEVARQTFAELPDLAGNVLHDAHTAILMREHGVRTIYTRDTDFHRFPFLEVLDPLRP